MIAEKLLFLAQFLRSRAEQPDLPMTPGEIRAAAGVIEGLLTPVRRLENWPVPPGLRKPDSAS